MPVSRPLTAAVVQASAVLCDSAASVAKCVALMSAAADRGAELVVFPEVFISGYPKGSSFGTVVGARDPQGRDEYRRYLESAIEIPGAELQALCEGAAAAGCYAVVGVLERDGGSCYCTVLFISPDGTLLGKHRKVMPTAMERIIWGFGDGSTLTVVDTPWGKLGAVICWENYMPMLRMAMYSKGISLYCAPTVDDRDSWVPSMRHIAMEGRCFVLSACQFVRRDDVPRDFRLAPEYADRDILIRGGSVIVDPLGDVWTCPGLVDTRLSY